MAIPAIGALAGSGSTFLGGISSAGAALGGGATAASTGGGLLASLRGLLNSNAGTAAISALLSPQPQKPSAQNIPPASPLTQPGFRLGQDVERLFPSVSRPQQNQQDPILRALAQQRAPIPFPALMGTRLA